jgi:hypothetical protein
MKFARPICRAGFDEVLIYFFENEVTALIELLSLNLDTENYFSDLQTDYFCELLSRRKIKQNGF